MEARQKDYDNNCWYIVDSIILEEKTMFLKPIPLWVHLLVLMKKPIYKIKKFLRRNTT